VSVIHPRRTRSTTRHYFIQATCMFSIVLCRVPSAEGVGAPQFEVLQDRTWVGRTIIRSTHALTYDQAKRLVAGKAADESRPPASPLPLLESEASWVDPLETDCSAGDSKSSGGIGIPARDLDPAAFTPEALAARRTASHVYAEDPPEGGSCGAPVAAEDEAELMTRLRLLTSVAQWLAQKRAAAGAVEFDSAELRFLLKRKSAASVSKRKPVPPTGGAAASVSFTAAVGGASRDGAVDDTVLPSDEGVLGGDALFETDAGGALDSIDGNDDDDDSGAQGGDSAGAMTTTAPIQVDPAAVTSKHAEEINNTIAELMIFANEATAKLTFAVFPTVALLRGHAEADSSKFDALSVAATALGVSIDPTSNASLGRTLKLATAAVEARGGKAQAAMLHALALRAMSRAEYFVSEAPGSSLLSSANKPVTAAGAAAAGSSRIMLRATPGGAYCEGLMSVCGPPEYGHYGLALNLYTHFTSPIRRYADDVVHSLIIAALATARSAPPTAAPAPSFPRAMPSLLALPRSSVASPLESAQWHLGDRPAPLSLSAAAGLSLSRPAMPAPGNVSLMSSSVSLFPRSLLPAKPPAEPPMQPAPISSVDLASLAEHLNERNQSAKEASWACNELFLALYLRMRVQFLDAVVTRVGGVAAAPELQVFIPFFNVTATVRLGFASMRGRRSAPLVEVNAGLAFPAAAVASAVGAYSAGGLSSSELEVALAEVELDPLSSDSHAYLPEESRAWLRRLPLDARRAVLSEGAARVRLPPDGASAVVVNADSGECSVTLSTESARGSSGVLSWKHLDRVVVALYCLWGVNSARRPPLVADIVADTASIRALMARPGATDAAAPPLAAASRTAESAHSSTQSPSGTRTTGPPFECSSPLMSVHAAAALAESSLLVTAPADASRAASDPSLAQGPKKRARVARSATAVATVAVTKGRACYGGYVPPAPIAPHELEMRTPGGGGYDDEAADGGGAGERSALSLATSAYGDISRAMAGASHPMFGGALGASSSVGTLERQARWGADAAAVVASRDRIVFGGSHGYGSEAVLDTPMSGLGGASAYSVRTGAGLAAGDLLASASDLSTVQRAALLRTEKLRAERRNDRMDKKKRADK
jgi:hypothetical protein